MSTEATDLETEEDIPEEGSSDPEQPSEEELEDVAGGWSGDPESEEVS